MKNYKIILAIFSFFLLTFLLRNITTWGVNDDFVIEQIINSREHPYLNSIVSFMSLPLGFLMAATYKIFGDYNWYGFLITFSNLVFLLATVYILNSYNNRLIRNISISTLALVFPFLLLNPTYTVTSILLSFSGLFLFLNNIRMKSNKRAIFFFSGFVLALGIAIRIDSLVGLLVFFGPFAVIYTFINKIHKVKLVNLILFVLPTLTLFVLQYAINFMVQSNNDENIEYLKWQENRHELFYTPAILKLHQNVAAGNVLKETWGDVEFTLLRNWAYSDQSVYSSKNLEIGRNFVDSYIGIKGLNNADPLKVLETLFSYLNNVKLFILLSIGLLISSLVLSRNKSLFSGLTLPLFGSFLISFYYGAAVLRLPIRVTVPYLITFMLIVLFCAEISEIKYVNSKFFRVFIGLSTTLFLIWFTLFKAFGFLALLDINNVNLNWAKQRNAELIDFDSNAKFIGPMVHMPSAASGPFLPIDNYSILRKSLVLSWSIFSPSWKSQARDLKINPENIYESLAKNKNLYFVSEPGLASVVDMYMNDHNILRGKMCPLYDLTGYDNAKIFTFQAKETDC
jgi:hypothetical protein